MKKFWKVLGFAALAAGLTPYKVEKNAETGENSYQALLSRITSAPGKGEDKRAIDINLGEGTLTAKLMGAAGKAEEPHLFSDELSVEYTVPEGEAAESEEPEEPEEPEESKEPEEPEEPAEPEAE